MVTIAKAKICHNCKHSTSEKHLVFLKRCELHKVNVSLIGYCDKYEYYPMLSKHLIPLSTRKAIIDKKEKMDGNHHRKSIEEWKMIVD